MREVMITASFAPSHARTPVIDGGATSPRTLGKSAHRGGVRFAAGSAGMTAGIPSPSRLVLWVTPRLARPAWRLAGVLASARLRSSFSNSGAYLGGMIQ
jgi:hypothetical protein